MGIVHLFVHVQMNYLLWRWCMCAVAGLPQSTWDLMEPKHFRSSTLAVLKKLHFHWLGAQLLCKQTPETQRYVLLFHIKSLSCERIHCQHSVVYQRSSGSASREKKNGKKKCPIVDLLNIYMEKYLMKPFNSVPSWRGQSLQS